jgi:hypothetical protein
MMRVQPSGLEDARPFRALLFHYEIRAIASRIATTVFDFFRAAARVISETWCCLKNRVVALLPNQVRIRLEPKRALSSSMAKIPAQNIIGSLATNHLPSRRRELYTPFLIDTPLEPSDSSVLYFSGTSRTRNASLIFQTRIEPASPIAFDIERLKAVIHMSYVKVEERLYEGDLSIEKQLISEVIKSSSLSPLLSYIQNEKKGDSVHGIGVLMVILGIKPSRVCELGIEPKLAQIVENLSQAGHLAVGREGGLVYLANEKPLEAFSPRNFLEPLSEGDSLLAALKKAFKGQDHIQDNQKLSYLLGFGPSWECYTNILSGALNMEMSCFSDSHYRQLGEVLIANHVVKDTDDTLSVGLTYHRNFKLFLEGSPMLERSYFNILLQNTETNCVLDGITVRTIYFKKSYTLKKWVMETFLNIYS